MADIFISFKTDDTPRVQAILNGFRARGLTVFWSNDIPAGAPDYHAIIKAEIRKAPVVVVVWTHNSVQSHPVAQEGAQAERENKLFQVLLDDIEPIDFPFEVRFKAQKTMLLGWIGNPRHPEWIKLNSAIDARLGRKPGTIPASAAQTARPMWARDAGQDEFGRWADFALDDVRQRMRWIEPGAFMMGSPKGEDGRSEDEGPQHEVTLTKGFWLGDTPVTQALWMAAMGKNPSIFKDPERPVETVSWDDMQQFLNTMNARIPGLGLRLPTEAQWEYACRAGTNGVNYAGDAGKLADIAWFGNIDDETHPVAMKRCNDWGLYDMLGNVWERCADGKRSYTAKPVADPAGPLEGTSCELRGGSWCDNARHARAASRSENVRGNGNMFIGFRCCA
jgi:formylglycine-generating enzyme required for sulfatase activity